MPKKTPRTKDSRLEIRLTEEEKVLFGRAAEADGRTLSNWIRFALRAAAEQAVGGGKGRGRRLPAP